MKLRTVKGTPQERVARTIQTVARSVPENLRPYLTYRGAMPTAWGFTLGWRPTELVIEALGKAPRRVKVLEDDYGMLYGRVGKGAK
jgi:hypothetical protein